MNKFMHWLLYEEQIFGNVVLTVGFKVLAVGIMLWAAVHINWKDQLEEGLDSLRYYSTCHATQKGLEEGC
mgnify:CR=1 FL=1|tara:strand:+ start:81 stop:290 length:210 start_codon:yes stop_codon:yes gene_type:complete